jgi:hypothetical protein
MGPSCSCGQNGQSRKRLRSPHAFHRRVCSGCRSRFELASTGTSSLVIVDCTCYSIPSISILPLPTRSTCP